MKLKIIKILMLIFSIACVLPDVNCMEADLVKADNKDVVIKINKPGKKVSKKPGKKVDKKSDKKASKKNKSKIKSRRDDRGGKKNRAKRKTTDERKEQLSLNNSVEKSEVIHKNILDILRYKTNPNFLCNLIIDYANKLSIPDDESYMVLGEDNILTIHDPKYGQKFIAHIGKTLDTLEFNHNIEPIKLTYEPRVIEQLKSKKKNDHHKFGRAVDCAIQLFGKEFHDIKDKGDSGLNLRATKVDSRKIDGNFEFIFYITKNKQGLYHRFFKPNKSDKVDISS